METSAWSKVLASQPNYAELYEWLDPRSIRLVLPQDYPTRFSIIEEPTIKNTGGKHEYGFATLRCDLHTIQRGRALSAFGGCRRRAPMQVIRNDKRAEQERRLAVYFMGQAIAVAYLEPQPESEPVEALDWFWG